MTDETPSDNITVAVDKLLLTSESGATVLDEASLGMTSGAITAVTGPSGTGKTMLLWSMLGHLPAGIVKVSGSVTVLGRRPDHLDAEQLRHFRRNDITFVGQDPGAALPPTMRVARLITQMTPRLQHSAAVATLAELGLSGSYLTRRCGQLSGGEQLRVALVRALYRRTPVLLLDEPFAGLDETRRSQVAQLLRRWSTEHAVTIVVTGHNVEFLESFADQVVSVDRTTRSTGATSIRSRVKVAGAPTLSARGLSAGIGNRSVFAGVDLDLNCGVLTALTGESGTGKTTLARVLVGSHSETRDHHASGSLELESRPLALRGSRRARDTRRRVQLVPQDPLSTLNPMRTVGQAIARPLGLRGVRDRTQRETEVRRLLSDVGLSADYADRSPREISGGQRQRVAIARALAARPAVLVCDEITSALDRPTSHTILELLLRTMDSTPMAVLFITHDLGLVASFCDKAYRMERSDSGATVTEISG